MTSRRVLWIIAHWEKATLADQWVDRLTKEEFTRLRNRPLGLILENGHDDDDDDEESILILHNYHWLTKETYSNGQVLKNSVALSRRGHLKLQSSYL
jgi:hypothetical protein